MAGQPSSSDSDAANASTARDLLTSEVEGRADAEEFRGTPPDEPPAEQEIKDIANPRSALALLRVFRHRNYRLFFTGQIVSLMGTWMQNVAQGWLVYSLTHSTLLLGVTSFSSTVTVFFVSPFGGMVADRVHRKTLLLFTQSAAMLQAAVLAALTLTHVVTVGEIIFLAFCMGFINAFDVPARQSMTLDMVSREDLRHAISLNSIMFNSARIIGPSLAGVLIRFVGEGVCFALNAASFAAVLTSLILMRLPQRERPLAGHPLREILDGYRYSVGTPEIRMSLLLTAASSLFGAAYVTMMPAIARDLLHGTSTAYGTLMAGAGAGALIGAYFLSQVHEAQLKWAPIIAAVGFGTSVILFAHSHVLWLSLVLILPTSACLMLLGGTTNTIIQMVAPERYRGRVVSHYTQSFMGMMPWGALLLGSLASRIGVTDAISFGGVAVIACAGIAYLGRRSRTFAIQQAAE